MSNRPAHGIMEPGEMLELANEQKMTRLYDKTTDGTEKVQALVGTLADEIAKMNELPIVFTDSLWNILIDHATVYPDYTIKFSFNNGAEITEVF